MCPYVYIYIYKYIKRPRIKCLNVQPVSTAHALWPNPQAVQAPLLVLVPVPFLAHVPFPARVLFLAHVPSPVAVPNPAPVVLVAIVSLDQHKAAQANDLVLLLLVA